ncbi:hypothetical protein FHS94_001611 [Sphingomonas aerophila]|uniref:Uncharacterized protein n=2 Tax=Sphingomonas aerophila TaxID=1344948 RepID=A0A7W9BCM7_9SPHN|nr:hypothetical protein [Sphingomonas aerophila]
MIDALQKRVLYYRDKQQAHDPEAQPIYNREQVLREKAETVELVLYEALIHAGFPAEVPEWAA